MKKNSEFVGVDEKFIPESEKYVEDTALGNEEEKKKALNGYRRMIYVFMAIPIIFGIVMIVSNMFLFNDFKDTKMNMYTFFHLQGTQSGYKLRDYLDDIAINNKFDEYTTITVVYKGESVTNEEEILKIKNQIPNTSTEDYEVFVDYADSRGQVVNKVTIKEIKDNGEN